MIKPTTLIKHHKVIDDYTEQICNHVDELHALNTTASKNGLKRLSVLRIVNQNQKYFKKKRAELSRCPVKIEWSKTK